MEPCRFSLARMFHDPGSDHVEINIQPAGSQMRTALYCSGMITVFPERAASGLDRVERLRGLAGDQLHGSRYRNDVVSRLHDQMDVVRRHAVVQHAQAISLAALEKPFRPKSTVLLELQQELLLATSMCDVSYIAWQEVAMGSGPRWNLRAPFSGAKTLF